MKNHIYNVYDRLKVIIRPVYLRNQTEKAKAFIAVGIVSFFWGTTWLASKKGVQHMPALEMAGIRQLVAGAVYLLFFFYKRFKLPTREQLVQFIWMGILMFVVNNGFNTWSMQYMPSGMGAVIGATAPLWIAVISSFVFKEIRLNAITTIGLLLGVAGVLVIFSDYIHVFFNGSFGRGMLLNIIASIAWAFGTIYMAQHAKQVNPYFSLGWQMFLGGIMLLLIAYISGQYVSPLRAEAQTWYAIAYLVIIGSVLTYAAFIYALKRLPAAQVSVHAYINPIVAVVAGATLNNEPLTMAIALGTLITIAGVYLVNRGFKKAGRS
ncbi:MAG: EamA family transporter [Sphingobacteriales bacterium]|nr:EamA family transporter [Sphingobacteriales bacterium]